MTPGSAVRRVKSGVFRGACAVAFALALTPLVALLVHATPRAAAAFGGPAASTTVSRLVDALAGSTAVVTLAAVLGVPVGVLAGAFASESSRGGRAARVAVDLLAGVPAVLVGLVAHVAVVLPMRGHSLVAGAAALALVVIPPVARGTDDLLRLVPRALRDTAVSLGLPRWRVVVFALLPAVRRGVAATSALAVSRALGETAPLVLTSFHAVGFPRGLAGPTPTLPVSIWLDASSPQDAFRARAWAAALILLAIAFALRGAASLLRRSDARATR